MQDVDHVVPIQCICVKH